MGLVVDKTRHCIVCGTRFEAKTAWHKYCSRPCSSKTYRVNHGLHKLADGRYCRQCGVHFQPAGRSGNNQQHCSIECSMKSARESRSKFWDRPDAKRQRSKYYKKSREKIGPDGNLLRFFKRHPSAPNICESCGEVRVLEIAHKPGFERNGAWRSAKNTKWPEMVWVLCPTCHKLLDRMGYTPNELGLTA